MRRSVMHLVCGSALSPRCARAGAGGVLMRSRVCEHPQEVPGEFLLIGTE